MIKKALIAVIFCFFACFFTFSPALAETLNFDVFSIDLPDDWAHTTPPYGSGVIFQSPEQIYELSISIMEAETAAREGITSFRRLIEAIIHSFGNPIEMTDTYADFGKDIVNRAIPKSYLSWVRLYSKNRKYIIVVISTQTDNYDVPEKIAQTIKVF
jgi:hypothetical protein